LLSLGVRGLVLFMTRIFSVLAMAAVPQVNVDPHIVRLPVVDGKGVRVTRITSADGLSQSRVAQIVQDDQGFMWFGTEYGLNRYDGYKFRVFVKDPRRLNSLGGNFVSALFKDRSGMLWIGTNRFLDRLDPTTETFTHYQVEPDDPAGTIVHISQDRAGMLWLATGTGVDRFDPRTGQIKRYRHNTADTSGLRSNDVQWTGEDRSGTFWVGTTKGLDAFDRETGKVTLHISIAQAVGAAFYEDRAGTFWVFNQSGNGLATLDKKRNQLIQYSFYPHDPPQQAYAGVASMVEDRQGNLWIASPGVGLLRFNPQERRFVRYRHDSSDPNSVAEDSVMALFQDREGNIWVGLPGHGTNHFRTDPAVFETFGTRAPPPNALSTDLVNGIYADRDGILWIGNDDGLNRINRKSGLIERWTAGLNKRPIVVSVVEDPRGHLWAGTWGNGLVRFERSTGRYKIFRHVEGDRSSLSSNLIHRVFIDHAGSLWVGTSDGLNRFDPKTERFTEFKADWNSRLSQAYVAIAEDPMRNVLWLGTHYSGLHRLDLASGQLKIYRWKSGDPHGLRDDLVPTVHVSASGEVWVGTQNGLNKLNVDSGTFTAYDETDGLSGNAVSCILEDVQGALWISTNRGLSRFDPLNKRFKNYSAADGLPGNDLTGWAACSKSPSGEMFFGGFSGGVGFYPERLGRISNSYAPPVAVTEFRLSGVPVEVGAHSPLSKSISYTSRLTLSHEQTIFSLAFSALSYKNSADTRYRYKLEGLETTWHEVGSDERLASYTTLPAGVFTFHLEAADSRGPWSEPGAKLEIEILPPIWKTAWFRTLSAGLILSFVWAAYRARLRQIAHQFNMRLEERVAERTRIARELHDTLLQSFHGLMFRYQAARNMLPRRPEEAMQTLDGALQRTEQAIADGRNAIQDLRSEPLSHSDLEHLLTATGQELEGSQDANLKPAIFRVTLEGKREPLSPIVQDEVYRIARELLRNAFQHAEARQIEAEIRYDHTQVRLRIRDDGKGMDPKILKEGGRTGHWGLPGIRERAKRFGARLDFWSEAGAGTEVELTVPASIAYANFRSGSGFRLFGKKVGAHELRS
jgi:ligand-binding sensor domain-containing protein/signal transduction histidine kinase